MEGPNRMSMEHQGSEHVNHMNHMKLASSTPHHGLHNMFQNDTYNNVSLFYKIKIFMSVC